MHNFISSVLIILAVTALMSAQGAHYTYPFSVPCPAALTSPDQTITLKAEFEGGHTGERYSPTYNWSVSAGTIISGQGTPSITLKTPRPADITDSVTVTLERRFREAHYPMVQQEASCVVHVDRAPEPRMIDEFRTAGDNCEEGFARLDSFFNELNNNPNNQGVIVVYGDLRDAQARARRELQLRNHFGFRNFPPDRVTFVQGADKENGTLQFWLVPPGANTPTVEKGSETIPKSPTEPYLYAANYIDGVAGCSGHFYDVDAYAKELKSLAGSRGRIVIHRSSRAKYDRELNLILRKLRSNGIPKTRITAVYKFVRPNRMLEANELWVIPAKK